MSDLFGIGGAADAATKLAALAWVSNHQGLSMMAFAVASLVVALVMDRNPNVSWSLGKNVATVALSVMTTADFVAGLVLLVQGR